jgi:hypothetical protein
MSDASLPNQLADAEGELPDDERIAQTIFDALGYADDWDDLPEEWGDVLSKRDLISAAMAVWSKHIKAPLAAAEAQRDAAIRERDETTRVCAQRASVIQILGHHPDMTIAEAYDAAERDRCLYAAVAPNGMTLAENYALLGKFADANDVLLSEIAQVKAARDAALARAERGEKALDEVEACMSIVEPRSDKAEYLRILGVVRAALADGKAPKTEGDAG